MNHRSPDQLAVVKNRKKEAFELALEAFKIHLAHHPETATDTNKIGPLFTRFFEAMETVVASRQTFTKFGPEEPVVMEPGEFER